MPSDADAARSDPCENCARPDVDLVAVHRVYVQIRSWDIVGDGADGDPDHVGSATVMDEIERWCFSCRSQYPHQPVD